MSLSFIKPGLLDTVQDIGRIGYGNWGINPGGAMDPYALQVANMLVGNCCTEAVIEIHFPGPQILFEQNVMIAVTGADFTPMLNDEAIPLWHPVIARKNTLLHFPELNYGSRCYLSVHGGICAEKWLNSYSTNLKAVVGGYKGQPLKKGDELRLKENTIYFAGLLPEEKNLRILPWQADVRNVYHHQNEILITKGNEWENLKSDSQRQVFENNFVILPLSDRMGYHLKGSSLALDHPMELLSTAVNFGTLQLLPDGQLIVLMADHQTTGGYPRIGHVISAHLPKLAQLCPGDNLHFKITDIETAEKLLISQQQELKILQRACLAHLNEMVC
ncbi:MAG TPA: biotin-dependent carboxyltransferase family protein [Puia sp.]|nr:biotin-dependent carboxyltransferase family protein [Puia sp.]